MRTQARLSILLLLLIAVLQVAARAPIRRDATEHMDPCVCPYSHDNSTKGNNTAEGQHPLSNSSAPAVNGSSASGHPNASAGVSSPANGSNLPSHGVGATPTAGNPSTKEGSGSPTGGANPNSAGANGHPATGGDTHPTGENGGSKPTDGASPTSGEKGQTPGSSNSKPTGSNDPNASGNSNPNEHPDNTSKPGSGDNPQATGKDGSTPAEGSDPAKSGNNDPNSNHSAGPGGSAAAGSGHISNPTDPAHSGANGNSQPTPEGGSKPPGSEPAGSKGATGGGNPTEPPGSKPTSGAMSGEPNASKTAPVTADHAGSSGSHPTNGASGEPNASKTGPITSDHAGSSAAGSHPTNGVGSAGTSVGSANPSNSAHSGSGNPSASGSGHHPSPTGKPSNSTKGSHEDEDKKPWDDDLDYLNSTLAVNGTKTNSSDSLGVIYFLTNKPQISIVMLNITCNGSVSYVKDVPIGGAGGESANSSNPILSHDAVVRGGDYLFSVNTGNNSLSVMSIDPKNPTNVTQVKGSPISTHGEMPVSVAISRKHHLACVLNSGQNATIACFKVSESEGVKLMNETIHPVEAPHPGSASAIVFNVNETQLLVSVKGDKEDHIPGSIQVFRVLNGTHFTDDAFLLANDSINATPDQCQMPIGMRFLPEGDNSVLIADAGYGVALSRINPYSGMLNASHPITIDGQNGTGWVTYSRQAKAFFVTDRGSNLLTEIRIRNGTKPEIVDQYPLSATGGRTDLIAVRTQIGEFLYVLAPEAGVVEVVRVWGPGAVQPVQSFDVKSAMGNGDADVQGMMVYMKREGNSTDHQIEKTT